MVACGEGVVDDGVCEIDDRALGDVVGGVVEEPGPPVVALAAERFAGDEVDGGDEIVDAVGPACLGSGT